MLTPMDIHNKEFKRSFRGYNENEIDEFLDQVVSDYEKLCRENDSLKEEVARHQKNIEQYQKLEKNLHDTLLVAQRTAEEVVSTAKKNAEELRDNTARECQNLRHRAEMDAKRQVDEAADKVRSIVAEYDRLVREKDQFLKKLRVAMESELTILNHTLDGFPNAGQEEPEKEASEGEISTAISSMNTVAMEKISNIGEE